jgi:hypothetical protein
MYIGPWQEYKYQSERLDRERRELNQLREQIVCALNRSLDPLAAQVAMDAVHPILDGAGDGIAASDGVARRKYAPLLARLDRAMATSTQYLLDGASVARSSSEPIVLVAAKKAATNKFPLLSLPPLVTKPAAAAPSPSYDTQSMLSVLKLARKQEKTRRKASSALQTPKPAALPAVVSKPERMASLRRLYRHSMTAMTDTLDLTDGSGGSYFKEHGEESGLSAVSKYFTDGQLSSQRQRDVTLTLKQCALSPPRISSMSRPPTADVPAMSPMGDEMLLRWSQSLDMADIDIQ